MRPPTLPVAPSNIAVYSTLASSATAGAVMFQHAQAALSIVETLRRERPRDSALLDDLQKSEFEMGRSFTVLANNPEAIVYYRRAISDSSASSAQNVALDHKSLGAVLIRTGALEEALAEYRAATSLDEERVRKEPADGRAKLDLSYDYADWGLILVKLHQAAAAVEKYRDAEKLRAAMVAADPRDARAASGLVSVEWRMGYAMAHAGDLDGAARAFRRAATEAERMISALPDSKMGKSTLADACWNIGLCYKDQLASCSKAEPWFLRSRQLFHELNQPTPNIDKALAECSAGSR